MIVVVDIRFIIGVVILALIGIAFLIAWILDKRKGK